MRPELAGAYLGGFIVRNKWTADRAKQVPGTEEAVWSLLRSADPPPSIAMNLASTLELQEALPLLRKVAASTAKPYAQRAAARAIYAMCGEALPVPIDREHFPAVDVSEDLFCLTSSFAVDLPCIHIARTCRLSGGALGVIVAYRDRERRATHIRLVDHSGTLESSFSVHELVQNLIVYEWNETGGACLFCMVRDSPVFGENALCALDYRAREKWRVLPPVGRFRDLAWMYDDRGEPRGVLANLWGVAPGAHGCVAVDLAGSILWEDESVTELRLSSAPCVPHVILACDGDTNPRLVDISRRPAPAALAFEAPGSASDGVILRRTDGHPEYALEVRGQGLQSRLVVFDEELHVQSSCDVAAPFVAMGAAYDSSRGMEPLVIVFCENGELLAIDDQCRLRWRGRVTDDPAVAYGNRGMDVFHEGGGRAIHFITHWGNRISVWQYSGK